LQVFITTEYSDKNTFTSNLHIIKYVIKTVWWTSVETPEQWRLRRSAQFH